MSEGQTGAAPESAAVSSEVSVELTQTVEALLFAADEPVSLDMIRTVIDDVNRDLPEGEKLAASDSDLRFVIDRLNSEYEVSHRAYRIQRLAGGFVFGTEKKFAAWVGKLYREKARRKLSQTAVETLAIIAYKQPITKGEVEFIRGVNADYIMRTLLEKNLTTVVGRAHSPGRPLLYGTTAEFLKHFGLSDISDLPKPREIEELLGETELEVEKRLLNSQGELEFRQRQQEKRDPNSRAPHIPRKKSRLQEPAKDGEMKTVVAKVTPPKPQERSGEGISHDSQIESVMLPPEEPEQSQSRAPEPPLEREAQPALESENLEIMGAPSVAAPPFVGPGTPEIAVPSIPEPGKESEDVSMFPPAEGASQSESKKGWSKWKIRVKTFFRRLFG